MYFFVILCDSDGNDYDNNVYDQSDDADGDDGDENNNNNNYSKKNNVRFCLLLLF